MLSAILHSYTQARQMHAVKGRGRTLRRAPRSKAIYYPLNASSPHTRANIINPNFRRSNERAPFGFRFCDGRATCRFSRPRESFGCIMHAGKNRMIKATYATPADSSIAVRIMRGEQLIIVQGEQSIMSFVNRFDTVRVCPISCCATL